MTAFRNATKGVLMTQNQQRTASTAADPERDVRGNITRLSARARQLLVNNTDTRVVRNGLSAYETSRRVAADVCSRAKAAGQNGSTQASVELFMASLGFNLQEQQRLLQQLQANCVPLAVTSDVDNIEKATGVFCPPHADGELGTTLETFVANQRRKITRQVVEETHRRIGDILEARSAVITRNAWEKYCTEVSDALESFSLKSGAGAGGKGERGVSGCGDVSRTQTLFSDSARSRAGVAALLSGRDETSTRLLKKIAAFANIVDTQQPSQWLRLFASHVADDAPRVTDEIALLWKNVEQILQPVSQQGSASTVMTFIASSRHVMEVKALVNVLSRTLNVDPERFGEMENMHATRFVNIVERYTSSSNPWAHIYTAMRCGRYDSAAIIANNAGFRLVEEKLKLYADAPMTLRGTLPPAVDLRPLYHEDATRADHYRHIVLLLLLLGSTGESGDVVLSTVVSLSSKVARSLEEMLWIRVFSVRFVEVRNDEKIQSLAEMQRLLLDDMQDLVKLVNGNVVRLASLLIHVLLLSSAMRLLIENDRTYVDGVHLAICFHNCQLLKSSDVEVSIDLGRLIPQYCTLVLLDVDRRQAYAVHTGTAIFNYFLHTNHTDVFVEYCGNELLSAKLFGHRGGGDDGLLLHGPPSTALLEAMERVAEAAVARGQTELAVRVLCVLERAASLVKDETRADYALRRAVQIMCPALSHSFHRPASTDSSGLAAHAAMLWERIAFSQRVIPHAHLDAFQLLCKMCEVFVNVARGDAEVALCCFWGLPFIPTSADDAERCAELFDATSECVATAAPPILQLAMQCMCKLAEAHKAKGQTTEAMELQRRARALTTWVRRWKRHVDRRLLDELVSLEQLFAF